ACMHLHFISKNIERAGDQVTSIADQVIYLATGELPEDKRPKDTTSVYEVPGEGGFSEADE
ncbi:MAG: phosphate transport system regulatory protein PhoU, partial [Maritimibacter sp.]|nr:phosphate transport system regulatory protein PhoU [Maritimibacter sp.]